MPYAPCSKPDAALAIHRTLQKTLAQPKDGCASVPSLAQCALICVQDAADKQAATRKFSSKAHRPAHCPPMRLLLAPPKRPREPAARRLERAVTAYTATLAQHQPEVSCSLAVIHISPLAPWFLAKQPEDPKTTITLIDLQNLLLQASWQPDIFGLWHVALNHCTDWLGFARFEPSPMLVMRRQLSQALAVNLTRLWHGLSDTTPKRDNTRRHDAQSWVQALVQAPFISELCDYDVLRRSLMVRGRLMHDTRLLQTQLMQAVVSCDLSARSSLQLRQLAYRLVPFEQPPCAEGLSHALTWVKRFALLGPSLKAASARIAASPDYSVPSDPMPKEDATEAQLRMRQDFALVELCAATNAYRRGVRDITEL